MIIEGENTKKNKKGRKYTRLPLFRSPVPCCKSQGNSISFLSMTLLTRNIIMGYPIMPYKYIVTVLIRRMHAAALTLKKVIRLFGTHQFLQGLFPSLSKKNKVVWIRYQLKITHFMLPYLFQWMLLLPYQCSRRCV